MEPEVTVFRKRGWSWMMPRFDLTENKGQTMVATCHSQGSQTESTSCFIVCSTLNGNIIHKMNFMLDWRRLETRDWEHTLIRKRFTEVEYQLRCRVIYHKLTYNQTYFWNQQSHPHLGDCRVIMLWQWLHFPDWKALSNVLYSQRSFSKHTQSYISHDTTGMHLSLDCLVPQDDIISIIISKYFFNVPGDSQKTLYNFLHRLTCTPHDE